jgi:solute carrier family 25 S-adenosylmethionine transporter 26
MGKIVNESSVPWTSALLSGGAAGTAVDVVLFPLDTIKTRLQSNAGFLRSGGFRNIYAGLGPAALGSAPGAALFFCTYETSKSALRSVTEVNVSVVHMAAASVSEIVACLVRVPIEIVKQRRQVADIGGASGMQIARKALAEEGLVRGLYRGYGTTVLREIPFALIQFPLWELFKSRWSASRPGPLAPWQSAACGSLAGAVAAMLTTPLDVAKTRIMLSEAGSEMAKRSSTSHALVCLWKEGGTRALFRGVTPRTLLISMGGAIFFGVYEKAKQLTGGVTGV